jgi:pimeloyl-ACP methyl ester carboxylesterase
VPRRVDVGGVMTSILEGGRGAPLVLLHGGIECGGVYWAPVIEPLAQTHRLVVPDVPGVGESAPLARMDPVVFCNWFRALLAATCAEPPMLVAHSLLGSYAAHFAARHRHALRQLVIYGAPGVGAYRLPLGLLFTAIRFGVRPSAANLRRFEGWAFHDVERISQRDAGWLEAFRSYMLDRAVVPHVSRTMRQLIMTAAKQVSEDLLRRIEVPTTLVWGRHDRMVPMRIADQGHSRFGWPLHIVEDAGHAAHLERPDGFLSVLADVTVHPGLME